MPEPEPEPEPEPIEVGDSILYTVKRALGVELEYTGFDTDILMGINTSIMSLMQLGVGSEETEVVTDDSAEWSDYLGEGINVQAAKTYIVLKTRLLFDPPSSFVIEAINKQIEEISWRLVVQTETPVVE